MPAPTVANYTETLSRCTLIEISCGIDFDLATQTCLRFQATGTP
jgi:hypothetical protein